MAKNQIDLNPIDISKVLENENKKVFDQKQEEIPDLSAIESLSRDDLIALIKRIGGAMWGIGLKTKEELADAFKLKLAIGGLSEKDMFKALPIMREWFDRELGKAAQSIAMTIEDKGISKLSDERLLRLERELSKMSGEDAVLITPMPDKLCD